MTKKKIILITGGSSNLGTTIAKQLAVQGHFVYSGFYSSSYQEKVKNVSPIKVDITSDISVRTSVAQIVRKSGKIDVLINCVGISKAGKLENSTLEEFDKLLDVNTKGAYRIIQSVLPVMRKQKSGKIINISSMSGLISFPNFGVYSASKFALEAFTTALRYEVLKDNIWVTNIEPGAILNETRKKPDMSHKTFREKYLMARLLLPLVSPIKVAEAISKVITSNFPSSNILIGRDVKLAHFAKKLLPTTVWDKLIQLTLS